MQYELLQVTSVQDAARYRALGLWRDETLYARFRRAALQAPDKLAIVCGSRSIRYGELLRDIDRLAGNLLGLGIAPGAIVAAQLPNSPEQPLIHLALNRIGALYMPLHESFRQTELVHLLAKAGAVAAILPLQYRGFDYPAAYAGMRGQLPALRHVFSLGGAGPHSETFERLLQPGGTTGAELDLRLPPADALGHIMLSSGTTALPKISVFTSNNLLAMLDPFARMIAFTRDDVSAALAPMGTGATGYIFPVLRPLLEGATAVILQHWAEPAAALELILEQGCTCATAIPTQMTLMLPALEALPPGRFGRFRCFSNAGAPLPLEVARRIEELMGCRVQSVYGSTDGGVPCMTSIDDPPDKRMGTVGRLLEGRTCELRDAQGHAVAPGEAGEICWRSPDKSYGYLNDMEAAQAAFDAQGFYRSGDLASIDTDGYVRIVGRVKDMILRGGRNISPRLIEELLIAHPAVREVAVAAMPHPSLGEQACAFVVLAPGQTLSLAQALEFLAARNIARYQLPERLEVLDELPRSAGGKIAKNQLTELVTARLVAEGKLPSRA
ncbi:MAG: AMP-binding protein [Nevskia sp.]|nr:AMP-binding protein [Nevskia sp.]